MIFASKIQDAKTESVTVRLNVIVTKDGLERIVILVRISFTKLVSSFSSMLSRIF